MTQDEMNEIAAVATDLHNKRLVFEAMRMQNQSYDAEEAQAQSIAYYQAETEIMAAKSALVKAQNRISNL